MPRPPLGIVGGAPRPLSATELERPQPPPSWGRFFEPQSRVGNGVQQVNDGILARWRLAIRAANIARAHRYAEASAEALVRYDRKGGK